MAKRVERCGGLDERVAQLRETDRHVRHGSLPAGDSRAVGKTGVLLGHHHRVGNQVARQTHRHDPFLRRINQPQFTNPQTISLVVPFIAVAVETGVYIYKVFKKFYNFVLPKIAMGQLENEAWSVFKEEGDIQKLVSALKGIDLELSYLSMELLSYASAKKQLEFAQSVESLEFEDIITCIETYKRGTDDEYGMGQLLVGSEYRRLYLLEAEANKVQTEILLGGSPIAVCCTAEGDIGVLLRENKLQLVHNLSVAAKVDLHSKPVTMVRQGVTFIVALMDQSVCAYNVGGQKLYTIQLQQQILCLESLEYGKTKGLKGLLVGMRDNTIRFYVDKVLINAIELDNPANVIKFGVFGREDGFLISIDDRGGIRTHVLQRQFNPQEEMLKSKALTKQQIEADAQQIQIPKKTKLFVEQAKREQDQGVNIHQIYQYDLIRLRLKTAQTYLTLIEDDQLGPQLAHTNTFRLQAQVNGLGPLFKIACQLENLGQNTLMHAYVQCSYNTNVYRLVNCPAKISYVIPRIAHNFEISIQSIDSTGRVMMCLSVGANDIVKVFIFSKEKTQPLIGALINMPLSDLYMD